ncbi:hypothetical protein D3C74_405750 [compost metagenome]
MNDPKQMILDAFDEIDVFIYFEHNIHGDFRFQFHHQITQTLFELFALQIDWPQM